MPTEEYYKKNPLTQVTFQIRFNKILELVNEVPASFQKNLGLDYIYNESGSVEITGLGLGTPTKLHSFTITTNDRSYVIILCSDYLQILTNTYKNFASFLPYIEHAINMFKESYPAIRTVNRIGFMYQNLITREKLEIDKNWKALLSEKLTPELYDGFPVSDFLSFTKIYNLQKSGYQFTCRNGLVDVINQNSSEKSQGYFIDIDGYLTGEIKYESILQHVKEIRKTNKWLFRQFITDELHSYLLPTTS